MKLGVILNTNDAETCWNCFRFCNEAIGGGHQVSVFLLGKGVEIEGVHDEKSPLLSGAVKKFVKNNGKLLACGTCLSMRQRQIGVCPVSSMGDMLKLVEQSDKVLTFG